MLENEGDQKIKRPLKMNAIQSEEKDNVGGQGRHTKKIFIKMSPKN